LEEEAVGRVVQELGAADLQLSSLGRLAPSQLPKQRPERLKELRVERASQPSDIPAFRVAQGPAKFGDRQVDRLGRPQFLPLNLSIARIGE
jgi:hypothetical protein